MTFGSYQAARDFCDTRRKRKLANNTYLKDHGTRIAIRLYSTDVVTYHPWSVELNSGGHRTMTTKDRISAYLPYPGYNHLAGEYHPGLKVSIRAQCGSWYISVTGVGRYPQEVREYLFEDGITIHDDGRVTIGGEDAPRANSDDDKRAYNREQRAYRKSLKMETD